MRVRSALLNLFKITPYSVRMSIPACRCRHARSTGRVYGVFEQRSRRDSMEDFAVTNRAKHPNVFRSPRLIGRAHCVAHSFRRQEYSTIADVPANTFASKRKLFACPGGADALESTSQARDVLTDCRRTAYDLLTGVCGSPATSWSRPLPERYAMATSLGEAAAENTGHGPETSRDADGQDRYRRHKALPPVAEGNTSTSRGVKTRQGRGRSPLCSPSGRAWWRTDTHTACAPFPDVGRGHIVFPRRVVVGRIRAWHRKGDVWTLVRVPDPTSRSTYRSRAASPPPPENPPPRTLPPVRRLPRRSR